MITDGRVVWLDRPDPTPGAHDLLVRVEAAGVNGADLLQRAGRYPPPPGTPPDQPGMECAGTVLAVGDRVTAFGPGERVMSLLGGAAQAEMAVVNERVAMKVPPDLGMVEAGGFPEVFSTAYDALFTQAALASGERLLVTGAAGGVGMAAVQLGRATGAAVVASARNAELHPRLSVLGATCAQPDEALELGPFDVVLELVGGPSLSSVMSVLAPGARVVVIGTSAGGSVQLNLHRLMERRATVRGSTLRNRSLEEKAVVARRLERHVLPLLSDGRVRVLVEGVFSFDRGQEAYERFAAGAKLGKIVLADNTLTA